MRDGGEVAEAMQRLGFGTNEAKVLVGLHGLGTATAREVSEATDVSRPQVYNAADALESRGLVNVQHASPRQFQPVTPDETASLLSRRFERDLELVTERLEDAASRREGPSEEREDIWTVRGQEAVSERVTQLVRDAKERIVFGVEDQDLLSDAFREVLLARAADGIEVTVVSQLAAVREQFADDEGIDVLAPPPNDDQDHTGRVLLVDDETVLHSVLGEEALPGVTRETAYWSSGSGFASTLVAMIERALQEQAA
jgi:sugar-specific transcriptional regulator TrmB